MIVPLKLVVPPASAEGPSSFDGLKGFLSSRPVHRRPRGAAERAAAARPEEGAHASRSDRPVTDAGQLGLYRATLHGRWRDPFRLTRPARHKLRGASRGPDGGVR